MSRRTAASIERGPEHIPQEDPDAPGTCIRCHRPLAAPNDRHTDQLPTVDPAITEAEARRYGEREDDDDGPL